MRKTAWHVLSREHVLKEKKANVKVGLSDREAEKRLSVIGHNKLTEKPKRPAWRLFLAQFEDLMVLILLVAAGISALLGDQADVLAIMAIVSVNAILGFMQEWKAEASLDALKQLAAPTCHVLRDGEQVTIPALDLVPGDIVELDGGNRVPADIRLLTSFSLAANESPLTGESLPVTKDASWFGVGPEAPGDQKNMLFMGTSIVRGRGTGVVVATGMATQIGEIAGLMQESGEGQTPLQQRLEQLGKALVASCIAVVAIVFLAGVAQGASVYTMVLTAVSLAVAAIPEGLPAVVTIALAIGVQRMIRRKAIVRRLPAVETLGCATVICSDKTGTLTKNEMTVVQLVTGDRQMRVTGAGYVARGDFVEIVEARDTQSGAKVDPCNDPDWRTAIAVGALCNHASVSGKRAQKPQIIGDPTEVALVVMAAKAGVDVSKLRVDHPQVAEIPFDSDRKRMSVVVRWQGLRSVVKGAPDVILDRCTHVLRNGKVVAMSPSDRNKLKAKAASLAGEALRVLALAYRPLSVQRVPDPPPEESLEKGLTFVALAAMMDPPREEVRRAIQKAAGAGVRTIMVTGDHRETAAAIGAKLGLSGAEKALVGDEIDKLSDSQLAQRLRTAAVFARVSPRHKLRIVRSLRQMGQVVAMTGDGVNDAPAVKEADIGIAMGVSGTDVTKEASGMVLADDNYATIVAAIEEGRGIYDNIRKFIRYLLACNVGEVLTMFITAVAGLPLPLVPIQILWMNLVTDGLPAVALSVDPPDTNVMSRPPRRPTEGVFSRGLHLKIVVRGLLIGLCTVAVFIIARFQQPENLAWAQTMAFTTLVMAQLIYVFQCRSEYRSVFEVGLFSNPYLLGAVLVSFSMQLLVIYLPAAREVFHTVPLSASDWMVAITFSGWTVIVEGVLRALRGQWRRHISVVRVSAGTNN